MVARAFEEFCAVDLRGKNVLVKPNMLRAAHPDEAIITDPQLIKETVAFLLNHGARVSVGDNPVPTHTHSEMQIAEQSGFVEASYGRFKNIGQHSTKLDVDCALLKEIYVSRDVLECDILVSLPKFRTHDLTTMTLAIKNQYGIVPGGLKPYIHSRFPKIEDFSQVLLEIYALRTPDIIMVDCLRCIDARGKRFAPNMIIAGAHGHAVDYVCAQIAGTDPDFIPTLRIARERGLFVPSDIEIKGTFEKLRGYSVPFRFPFRNAVVELVARVLYRIWLHRKPVVDSSLCTQCLSCEAVCPVDAIDQQTIDYDRCIKCYCCLEVCPEGAIQAKYR
jgi:uncharacterized protein (DUF362 family)/Pyruvate/2-oxoacid:ferredoxin oxidoreductase delta subunit